MAVTSPFHISRYNSLSFEFHMLFKSFLHLTKLCSSFVFWYMLCVCLFSLLCYVAKQGSVLTVLLIFVAPLSRRDFCSPCLNKKYFRSKLDFLSASMIQITFSWSISSRFVSKLYMVRLARKTSFLMYSQLCKSNMFCTLALPGYLGG